MRTRSTPRRRSRRVAAATGLAGLLLAACGGGEPTANPSPEPEGPITVYSGRSEELVAPIIDRFAAATGIEARVRYGDTAELAATILEEGQRSPADVYFGQDAGALGALAAAGRFQPLPDTLLDQVEPRFRSPQGLWVGVSGRARTVIASTAIADADLPSSVFDLTDERWRGRVGWAPTNGSFQAFVTAMRVLEGEERTRSWLEGLIDNQPKEYPGNTPIVDAVGRGEIDLGLVNHYYLFRFLAEDPGFGARNVFLQGDIGGLINVAGIGVLDSADQPTAGQAFVEFLLGEEAQRYFADETFEYPLTIGVAANEDLPPLASLETPGLDLSNLDDLQGTLELLRQVGALQ